MAHAVDPAKKKLVLKRAREQGFGAHAGSFSVISKLFTRFKQEHSGALIAVTDEVTAPLNVRGLQVHACGSNNPSVFSEHVRLARCSDGGVCGVAATCTDALPLPSAPNLTTVDCSCQGEFFPSPAAASAAETSLALAPYGFDPSIDYCVRWIRLEPAQRLSATHACKRARAGHAARRRYDHA